MRLIAVRRSVTARPLRLSDAEFEIRSRRAARAGSDPTTRTTCSTDDFGSDKTRLTRTAISGNEGRSTFPTDNSAARVRTKSNAAVDAVCGAVFVKFALTLTLRRSHAEIPARTQEIDRPRPFLRVVLHNSCFCSHPIGRVRRFCVARVAMGGTHASRGRPWMVAQGLRGAGQRSAMRLDPVDSARQRIDHPRLLNRCWTSP